MRKRIPPASVLMPVLTILASAATRAQDPLPSTVTPMPPATAAASFVTGTLGDLAASASRRFGCTIGVVGDLADLRVVYVSGSEERDSWLGRMAELTDSDVLREGGGAGKPVFRLQRRLKTLKQEEVFKELAVLQVLSELSQAVDWKKQNDPRLALLGKDTSFYISREHCAIALGCLRRLSPEVVQQLLDGKDVLLTEDILSQPDRDRMAASIAATAAQYEAVPGLAESLRRWGQDARAKGIRICLDRRHLHGAMHLDVKVGVGGLAIGSITDEDLGLPNTRTNPYRLLELKPGQVPRAPELPEALRKPLDTDLAMPADGAWRSLVLQIAHLAGMPAASDDYAFRLLSSRPAGPHAPPLARKGVPLADAIDLACREFGYLWWEKDGCCFFRPRCWPRDVDREIPERVLERWRSALARGAGAGPREMALLASLRPAQIESVYEYVSPEVVGFLNFYRRLDATQQASVLSQGLLVPSDADPAFSLLQEASRGAVQPLLLQVTQRATPDPSKPGAWRDAMVLRVTPKGRGGIDMSFELRIPGPMPAPAAPN